MNASLARKKAFLAFFGFGIVGCLIAISTVNDWNTAALPIAFYIVLVINTFFSVKVFSEITPRDNKLQNLVDGILVIIYFILASQFQKPLGFVITATLLFLMTIIKYFLLLHVLPEYRRFLIKKISLNSLGFLLLGSSVIGIAAGYTLSTEIFYITVFALVNIYILVIKPLYTLDGKHVKH